MILMLALALGPAAPAPGGLVGFLAGPQGQIVVYGAIMMGFFYFAIYRPQQARAKAHTERMRTLKRGDTVVLSSGLLGRVVRVEESEIGLEIAQNVVVKVVKSMVSDIRTRSETASNDTKS
jgi:preprotein translocase subunit YajC